MSGRRGWPRRQQPVDTTPRRFEPPPVIEVRTDWLHGPVHDWFLVPAWLHAEMHKSGIAHEHRGADRAARSDVGET